MKVIMHPAISLDGYVAKSDGDSSWVNQEDETRYRNAVEKCGGVIVGNTTYEQFKHDFESYNNVVTFVCTTKPKQNAEKIKFVKGTAEDIVKEIEKYNLDEVVICGGGDINGLFASAGLVDEIVVSIQSLILGDGIPLFGKYKPNMKLKLLDTNNEIDGVVQNRYLVVKDRK